MMSFGAMPCRSKRHALRAVAHIDHGLCRHGANACFGPEHAVTHREDARLHGGADLAGFRIETQDRERAWWIVRIVRRA